MREKTIERRRLLHGAGAAAGGAAVVGMGVAAAQPAAASGSGRLEGSWLVDVQSPDGPLVSVASFADGGVAITHDISPAGPPFTGTWAQHGKQWRATLWSGFPGDTGPGSVGPTARLRLRGEVKGDRIRGTFTFTIFVPGADPDSFSGTFTGRRIEA